MSLINETSSSTLVSVQLLNKTLLRSANFYEAKCFKGTLIEQKKKGGASFNWVQLDCNIPIILNALVELFGTKLKESSVGDLSNKTIEMITSLEISKVLEIDTKEVQSLSTLLSQTNDAMDEDVDATTTSYVNQLCALLKLLLLFPNECFEKTERSHVVYLATLIDIWSVTCGSADVLYRMKVSLMCRGLQLKFMDYFSTHSLLVSNTWPIEFPFFFSYFCCCCRVWMIEYLNG